MTDPFEPTLNVAPDLTEAEPRSARFLEGGRHLGKSHKLRAFAEWYGIDVQRGERLEALTKPEPITEPPTDSAPPEGPRPTLIDDFELLLLPDAKGEPSPGLEHLVAAIRSGLGGPAWPVVVASRQLRAELVTYLRSGSLGEEGRFVSAWLDHFQELKLDPWESPAGLRQDTVLAQLKARASFERQARPEEPPEAVSAEQARLICDLTGDHPWLTKAALQAPLLLTTPPDRLRSYLKRALAPMVDEIVSGALTELQHRSEGQHRMPARSRSDPRDALAALKLLPRLVVADLDTLDADPFASPLLRQVGLAFEQAGHRTTNLCLPGRLIRERLADALGAPEHTPIELQQRADDDQAGVVRWRVGDQAFSCKFRGGPWLLLKALAEADGWISTDSLLTQLPAVKPDYVFQTVRRIHERLAKASGSLLQPIESQRGSGYRLTATIGPRVV